MPYRELTGNLKQGSQNTHVGNKGTISVDTETKQLVVHDGITPGGNPLVAITETLGTKLRRNLRIANVSNPLLAQNVLVGGSPWVASTAVTVGGIVGNGVYTYICTIAGTTASSGGPTGTGAGISDGTATWDFYALRTAPIVTIAGSNPLPSYTQNRVGASSTSAPSWLRFLGGQPAYDSGLGTWFPTIGIVSGGFTSRSILNAVEFMTDELTPVIDVYAYSQPFTILVDGKYIVSPTGGVTYTGVANNHSFVKLDFTALGRQARRITVELNSSTIFAVWTGSTSSGVWLPQYSDMLSLFVLGDSLVGGSSANSFASGFPEKIAKYLGFQNAFIVGVGGAGFLQTGNGGWPRLFDPTVLAEIIAQNPSVIYIAAGINDTPYTTGQISSAVQTGITTLRASLPNTPIFIQGPAWTTQTTYQSSLSGIATAIITAAQAASPTLLYPINNIAEGWMSGTGNTTAPTGSGNADNYYGVASTPHPNQLGHDYLTQRMLNDIVPFIQAMP